MEIEKNKNITPYSTFKIKSASKYFVEPTSEKEIQEAINWAKEKNTPYKILGGGSNVVFPDKKFNGLIIKISNNNIEKISDTKIKAGAGTNLKTLIDNLNNLGLKGLETLTGIPGTLGGAIVGNAGAYGHSISEKIKKVNIIQNQKTKTFKKKECKFKYRDSIFKKQPFVITSAILNLEKGNFKKLKEKSKKITQKRNKKYPPNIKSSGCFFKNILTKNISKKKLQKIDRSKIIDGKIPAGYLLEKVDAKGMKVGDIQIANFHSNFFINTGNGTKKEIRNLAEKLKKKVLNRFDLELEEEVRYF
ncbi:MAG TPA: UDP-N-acetylmuramate dehydrogenase [Candidatus Paceibacterota bacterium]|nr:UDP-N-acetylmuramate dehydrogenase [Candidatus Paceibacterota bacterium]